MAVYFLHLKTFGRSTGNGAVSAAAYRSGERLRDERTGRTYDHSERLDVLHKEIVLPTEFRDTDMSWARDRSNLWNAAEGAESRSNARVAREFLVALPVELNTRQQVGLAREFSQELADRYRFAVDVSLHAPRDFPDSDPRNFHAHLLATTREVTPDGLAAKTSLEMHDVRRAQIGLQPGIYELLYARERWAQVTNHALEAANSSARIDHRSLAAQGIDREPYPHIPKVAFEMERRGYYSPVAEQLRRDHAERVEARLALTRGTTAVAEPVRQGAAEAAVRMPAEALIPAPAVVGPRSMEEVRRQARENWQRLRQQQASASATGGSATTTKARGIDDDLAN